MPLLVFPLFAREQSQGVTSSGQMTFLASTLPEAKVGYTHRFVFPFLQGGNPLTAANNITVVLTAEATPISVNGLYRAVWTPLAFIELLAGGRIGSGWPITLFGRELYGIGLNLSDEYDNIVYSGSAFDALLWQKRFGGAFQFNLAAIFPGDWNSVLFRTYHEINYHGNTRARRGQSWYFEGGDGENMNGFNYFGTIMIGYQMPMVLNLVGLLAEMERYLYDTPNRRAWGEDLIRWTFSCVLGFRITERLGLSVITQLRTRRNFRESHWEDLHYRARTVNRSNPQRLEFYRVVAAINYRL